MNYELIQQMEGLLSDEKYLITALSNSSALLNENLNDINWVGYYLYQDDQLILGPFQGKVACEIIQLDKGVCGHCATTMETVVVDDVHKFPGHIACDSASNSEIVIPIRNNGTLFGVLDIDSPLFSRFSDDDRQTLEKCVELLEELLKSF